MGVPFDPWKGPRKFLTIIPECLGGLRNVRGVSVMRALLGVGSALALLALVPAPSKAETAKDELIERQMKATTNCASQFRQKFENVKGKDFATCLTEQVHNAIQICIGKNRDDFAPCVIGNTLRVTETCDLSRC